MVAGASSRLAVAAVRIAEAAVVVRARAAATDILIPMNLHLHP